MKKEYANLRLIFPVILLSMLLIGFPLFSLQASEEKNYPPPPENWPEPVHDDAVRGFFMLDRLEYGISSGDNSFTWDAQGWLGSDYNKIWVKSEGEHEFSTGTDSGENETQLLYSRLIAPFWYLQVGGAYEQLYGEGNDPSRFSGVVGVQGLAPYWFEVEPAMLISEDGDISFSFEAEYDLLFTQRLILQPRFESQIAIQEVEKFGVGEGLNNIELGIRLRYEIRREFAPYIGISWNKLIGDTADIARSEGEDDDKKSLLVGIRMWF